MTDEDGLQFTNGFYRCVVMRSGRVGVAWLLLGGCFAFMPSHPPASPSHTRRDGESGGIFVFGPTLRIKAGEPYWIYLANNMYIGPNSTQASWRSQRL